MDARSCFASELLDLLWEQYRSRVRFVGMYEKIVEDAGARFINDHVAFRTLARQRPPSGIASVSRVFEALGWTAAGAYSFPDKKLSAVHFTPPDPALPKLFVSEFRTWELSEEGRERIRRVLVTQRPPLSDSVFAQLHGLESLGDGERRDLLKILARYFLERSWEAPTEEDVRALNEESQYAAWVALYGFQANHFTAAVHAHGAGALSDIEKTVAALKAAGVPMKGEIEGAPGSALRQSATEAAVIPVEVQGGEIDWPYAYFEIAERPLIDGKRFEGFLGPQATNLFEMTKKR